jgi:adenylate kinase family enzyme
MFPQPSNPIGQRIVVIGTTGSGKTTLATQLARRLGASHIELDALHWEPDWAAAPLDVFRARVTQALSLDSWVADGNYSKVRDIVWGRADSIVWLDYSLPVILGRLTRRTVHRIITREELWNGNRENLRGAFFSRDSIFLWALKTYRKQRRIYPPLFAQPEYHHLTIIRLPSPHVTNRWLDNIEASALNHTDTSCYTAGVSSSH